MQTDHGITNYHLRHRPPRVLLVEDDPADQELVTRSLHDRLVELRIVDSGAAALDAFVNTVGQDHWDPDIILLDLNLPGLSGASLLPRLKEEVPRWVPIIVFSSSNNLKDAVGCYEAGCNTFITKPSNYEDFAGTINLILTYWLDIADV